ncbi:uncharacterized protein LOC126460267 [Schistocerca serialis cubense]|uniref:uncharacterized protein LOC126460267 n=1 Tax=Schistocerca serialis cubense TaxID=2023355 RepID=UPI00214EED32|nr:uncharacterized protein LOC126460267 [Schistocerca serialis cubense]
MAPLADRGAVGESPGSGVSGRTVLVLSLVGVGAGLLLAGLALAAILIGVRRRRLRRAGGGRAGADGASPRDKAPPSSLPSSDDNPDVVPQKEEAVLPVADLKALQQYGLLLQEARRPATLVDSAAQTTVVYGASSTFPMTEAVVLAPCWAAGAAPLPGGGAGPPEAALPSVTTPKTPRHDAGTQTPLPSRHKESAV